MNKWIYLRTRKSCHLPNRYRKRSPKLGKFKSQLEQKIAKKLGKAGSYEFTTLNYLLPKRYIPDFHVTTKTGQQYYLEVKGYFRYEDQQKMKYVKISHPDLDIRMFFPVDGKVQGSKMRCSDWCVKYNYPFAVGSIPRDWLK